MEIVLRILVLTEWFEQVTEESNGIVVEILSGGKTFIIPAVKYRIIEVN